MRAGWTGSAWCQYQVSDRVRAGVDRVSLVLASGQFNTPFTIYNLNLCDVNTSDRSRPTQMARGPGPPRGGRLGPDRRGSARYDL